MAIKITKKCPYCGLTYRYSTYGDQRLYGSPYKTCIKCLNHFWDKDIVEPALYGFENLYETGRSIMNALILILYAPVGLLMLGGGIWLLTIGKNYGLLFLALGGFITWAISSDIKDKINNKKNRESIIRDRQVQYDNSMKRLNDTNYLAAIANFDRKAKKLLHERINGEEEHYAPRPQQKI